MAAYAALVSLITTLNNIQIHPQVSTFFDHEEIQSLHEILGYLLHFVETINSHGGTTEEEEVVDLERRIASTAHAAEDAIESHLVKQIIANADAPHKAQIMKFEASNLINGRKVTFRERLASYITCSFLDLKIENQGLNAVKKSVMEFQRRMKLKDEQSSSSSSHSMSATSSRRTTTKTFVVGFDEKLIQIMDTLTRPEPGLQIVPIVGMGGIGKTTIAKSVYENLLIVESFDIRAWVTVSQEYSVKNVFSELLSCINDRNINARIGAVDFETDLETEDHQLGLKLYQTLSGRRYLIVLDDIWSLEAWDKIKCFFPNNGDRSRVVITTRISSVATNLSSSSFEMSFLDEDQSWQLFCVNVFQENGCPPELENIGKKIVRECKGLPLSIVVIGGILRNSKSTRDYWENFARDLNSILMSGNDEHCFKILSLSYNQLPSRLKPCFLYLGVFREDEKIRVSELIKLFVAEGFLKRKEGQTMEEVAEDSLNDLVDRNLILVDSLRWDGGIKYCKMHDLVRELCSKIAEREKIFHRMRKLHIPADINRERRIVFDEEASRHAFDVLPSASLARTFLSSHYDPLPLKFRLLRVLYHVSMYPHEHEEDISQHVNLRYLNWTVRFLRYHFKLPSSISLLWNVQTLIFVGVTEAPSEIWYMRQLRHVQFDSLLLTDPPPMEQKDDVLLPNLLTLSKVANFSFTEDVCKRIPNIKKLGIAYINIPGEEYQKKCYYDLGHLHKLQSLYCRFEAPERDDLLQSLVFPSSLRKLCLGMYGLRWGDLNTFGLSLPHLEVLKLYESGAVGDEWDCVEGAFPRLKFLQIELSARLIKWTAESSDCFPVLEKLHLKYLNKLEKIPSCIGEIQSLESLQVNWCSFSAAISSIEILEEQLTLGNEELRVKVNLLCNKEEKQSFMENVELNNFTTKNFSVTFQ